MGIFKNWLSENTRSQVPRRAWALFAAEVANKALPVFEQQYPNDDRPRKAIEIAFDFALTGNIDTNAVYASNDASNAAFVASDGSNAAYAAANAAYAAANAAYATWFASDAALAASNAANAAASATGEKYDVQRVIGPGIEFENNWLTTATIGIAKQIWNTRNVGNLPILADALMDASVEEQYVHHLRDDKNTLADWWLWNINLN